MYKEMFFPLHSISINYLVYLNTTRSVVNTRLIKFYTFVIQLRNGQINNNVIHPKRIYRQRSHLITQLCTCLKSKTMSQTKRTNPFEYMDGWRLDTIRNTNICPKAIMYKTAQFKLHSVHRNINMEHVWIRTYYS